MSISTDIANDGLVETFAATPGRNASVEAGDASGRQNLNLLIQLRWLAVTGQIATILFTQFALGIGLPLEAMTIVLATTVAVNLLSMLWLRQASAVGARVIFLSLLFDLLALTAQLYFSGGATNPFVFLYIVQVTLSAVLLRTLPACTVAVLAALCLALLSVFNRPLALPSDAGRDLFTLHIIGTFVCFVLDGALLVAFVTRINRNMRARDIHLADLRQHAAEEDHIVRMGLLASGAAHELGTPLSSLSVILGDWRHMPALASDPAVLEEIEEMQMAVDRCKAILTGILLSAGEARGDAPAVTTVNAFLDSLVADWRDHRPGAPLRYENLIEDDVPIVSDTALKQVIFNVLDNAAEASPTWSSMTVERTAETLVLRVADAGPGFSDEMLAQFGKPYSSSKGRPGGGLGLFLVVNVVRKLGGTVSARNRASRGALVTISLPLETLMTRQSR
ncbi:MAG TPA: ATP-binding protein [Devosia sp.]|nr:ATP-binding protein [Devosia sp.]